MHPTTKGYVPIDGGLENWAKARRPRKISQILNVWLCVCQLVEAGGRGKGMLWWE
jgi:hypothetical protein